MLAGSALPVVCTCHRQRCWTRLDGDKIRQSQQARRCQCQWIRISACLLLGPPTARGYAPSQAPRRSRLSTLVPTSNLTAQQPLLGLILMADFAQGLDASKLILAETVRFSNSCGYLCSSPQLTRTHAHIAALLHHHPIHCPCVQLSPLSLWLICAREPRSSPPLTSSGKFHLLLTDFHLY